VPEASLQQALKESTADVLEKMFLVRCLGALQAPAPDPEMVAHLTFEGEPSGSLTLRVPSGAARSVAADFLGEQEPALSEQQISEVLCELANMICGSVLSRVESNTTFRLASPQIVASLDEVDAAQSRSNRVEAETAGAQGDPHGAVPRAYRSTHAVQTCRGALVVMIKTEPSLWRPAKPNPPDHRDLENAAAELETACFRS
jgi:CheY-specific phosphatase CheX